MGVGCGGAGRREWLGLGLGVEVVVEVGMGGVLVGCALTSYPRSFFVLIAA